MVVNEPKKLQKKSSVLSVIFQKGNGKTEKLKSEDAAPSANTQTVETTDSCSQEVVVESKEGLEAEVEIIKTETNATKKPQLKASRLRKATSLFKIPRPRLRLRNRHKKEFVQRMVEGDASDSDSDSSSDDSDQEKVKYFSRRNQESFQHDPPLNQDDGQEQEAAAPIPNAVSRFKLAYHSSKLSTTEKVSPKNFQKIKIIGKGDVGKILLVRNKDDGNLYVMKILSKMGMLERSKVKRVLIEQEVLVTSNHPFIVSFYHSFQTVDNIYFVTEYCTGGEFFRTLQGLRNPDRCLSEEHARFYAAEVLLGLEFMHLMGFINRDLKPENLLLHKSGHIILADFDLSKPTAGVRKPLTIETTKSSFLTKTSTTLIDTRACTSTIRTNSFVGTQEYIAPEIIMGQGHSVAVDFWTFGVLIYEMLYSKTPFKGPNKDATFKNVISQKLTFPKSRDNPVGIVCKNLMRELMIKDEFRRLGSRSGASDVKAHPFFKNVKWALLRNMTPPIKPTVGQDLEKDPEALGLDNFKDIRDDDSLDLSREEVVYDPSPVSNPFYAFESVSRILRPSFSDF